VIPQKTRDELLAEEWRDDPIARAIVYDAKEDIRNDLAAIKRRIEADEAIASTPIQLDLEAAARKIKQRGPRLFVGEISAMDRLHSALIDAMQPHVQSAFSVLDLVSALHDAGCDFEEEAGEVSVSFGAGTDLTDREVDTFRIRLALAAPRYAEAIMHASDWNEERGAYVWDVRELARRAA
jgi:hypothetical protein